MIKNCIVRDLDGIRDTTSPMDCVQAIKLAKSGEWAKNWTVEECLENPNGSAPILKKCITFNNGLYECFSEDHIFNFQQII